jgi:hypothetical protein
LVIAIVPDGTVIRPPVFIGRYPPEAIGDGARADFPAEGADDRLHRPGPLRRFYEDVLGASPDPRDGYGCPWYRLGAWSISLMPNAA